MAYLLGSILVAYTIFYFLSINRTVTAVNAPFGYPKTYSITNPYQYGLVPEPVIIVTSRNVQDFNPSKTGIKKSNRLRYTQKAKLKRRKHG